jgi:hypothetical protein
MGSPSDHPGFEFGEPQIEAGPSLRVANDENSAWATGSFGA